LESNFSGDEILELLDKNIDQKSSGFQIGFGGKSSKRFFGKINNKSFKASRVLNYRNTFSPIVFGVISQKNNNSTEIKLKLRIHQFIKIFSIVWFTGFTLGSSLFALFTISSREFFPPVYLIILVPIAMFLVFNYFFNKEVKLSKEILMQILEAKEI